MATLVLTIVGKYEADAEDYGTTDPTEMARMDLENIELHGVGLEDAIAWCEARDITVTVTAEP